jgi:hypothetical protein
MYGVVEFRSDNQVPDVVFSTLSLPLAKLTAYQMAFDAGGFPPATWDNMWVHDKVKFHYEVELEGMWISFAVVEIPEPTEPYGLTMEDADKKIAEMEDNYDPEGCSCSGSEDEDDESEEED